MTARTGRPHGGARTGAGRPRGSRTKVFKPHAEKQLQAAGAGMLPKDVLLAIMHMHFEAGRWGDAERTAALVAPYIHPKLTATALSVRPSIAAQLVEMSDDELRESVREMKRMAGLPEEEGLATVAAKGRA